MTEEDGSTGTIKRESFGRLSDGREALLFTLTNKNGMELKLTDFGAAVVSIIAPELSDGRKDMVLGFDDVSGYEATGLYLGATIGRYAGQIKNGSFEIRGAKYDLYRNDHGNTLHGGEKGFDKRLFSAAISEKSNEVVFTYFSPDMEEGFPGNLSVSSGYTLTEDNKVIIRFQAKSDRDTVLNMTNHCYYNLDGHDSGNVMGHSLRICAENYLKVGEDCAPDGEILPVEGSPMDFRTAHAIGDYIEEEDRQLAICGGYDHNWNIDHYGEGMRECAELTGASGRRSLRVFSDLPGLQMYSGNYLNEEETGKGGIRYGFREALCLEPQFYPNAPCYKHFPSPFLKAGETFDHSIVLEFKYKSR